MPSVAPRAKVERWTLFEVSIGPVPVAAFTARRDLDPRPASAARLLIVSSHFAGERSMFGVLPTW